MKSTMPVAACLLLLTVSPLAACLWDLDTIKMETQRFPGTLELITGKFLRHSKPFYGWRIKDREKRIAEATDNDEFVAALYDDLAVAQEKTGNTSAAIETMLKKQEIWPDKYTTQANLGTFYIHNGELEKGLEHIERAIEINPHAHFGREVYQKLLVEYVLSRQVDGETLLPLSEDLGGGDPELVEGCGFAAFVLDAKGISRDTKDVNSVHEEIDGAIKGVQGMMHFGNYRSPILLEALASLLLVGDRVQDARLLACRACLAASTITDVEEVKEAYRKQAYWCLNMQTPVDNDVTLITLDDVEAEFVKEQADADAWFLRLCENESKWISEGLNPEAEFDAEYRSVADPSVAVAAAVREDANERDRRRDRNLLIFGIAVLCLFVATIGAGSVFIVRWLQRR